MDFELLRTRDDLLAIREQWETLWARSHGDYHLSFLSCLLSWDTTHAPRNRKLVVAVARTQGRLAAVLPMTTHRRALWTVAVLLGPEAAEGGNLLQARDAAPELAPAILRFLMRAAKPHLLNLSFVRSGNALDRAVLGLPNFRALTHTDRMPYALLSGEKDWAGYERSLSRGTQAQTARKRRRLDEAGMVGIEIIEGQANEAIDWLLDEKAKWGRKVDKLGGWLFAPSYRAYLKGYAAAGATRSGTVLTFTLRLDGRLAAVKTIVVGPNLCTLLIAAYDEDLARFSPGNILDEVWIRHVFEHFRDERGRRLDIDFGTGVERYKLHWGRGFAHASHSYKVAVTRWGELPYRMKAVVARVRTLRAKHGTRHPSGGVEAMD